MDPFFVSLLSGACAGTATDLAFFPIDTIKTRLQAKGGFFTNGGWHGIYKGLGLCVVGSAPSAALFFITYDAVKRYGAENGFDLRLGSMGTHMAAALAGEVAACVVRVPVEVTKQRTQAGRRGTDGRLSSWLNFKFLVQNKSGEGVFRGLYRGWSSTLMREIPFTIIQFPLYEILKEKTGSNGSALGGAMCGSVAGAVAASLTTPLDVIKTRIMLNQTKVSFRPLVSKMVKEEGYRVFWNGVGPRTAWISAGGAIFLGVYELVSSNLKKPL